MRRVRRAWSAVLATGLAVSLLGMAGAGVLPAAQADDGSAEETQIRVQVRPEASGEPVRLDASVFTPAEGTPGADEDGRRAAVVLAHGFGGAKGNLADRARTLAGEGYVVLTYTARGFGESGGLIHLDAPAYEVADASALLDRLAERDDVRLDAPGDPRVGVAGGSYGGALALLAAGYDDRVDAIVPAITWHDLARSLFGQYAVTGAGPQPPRTPAAVRPVDDPGVLKRRWAALLYGAGLDAGPDEQDRPGAGRDPTCGRFAPRVCRLYREAATSGEPSPGILSLLRRRSPARVIDRIDAPTLLLQGQQDSLFPLEQADANARGIAADGTPVAVHWLDGGHDATGTDVAGTGTQDATLAWFDHYLRDGPNPGTAFEFSLPGGPLDRGGPEQRVAESYGAVETRRVRLAADPQPFLSPPGGAPTAITGLPGTGGVLGAAPGGLGGVGYALAALPGESAVFESPPLEETSTVVGAPRVRLQVTSSTTEATLFVSLWVVTDSPSDPDGTATLPRRLVSPVHLTGLTPGEPREVAVALPASAYRLEQDQQLRLVVSSTDAAYAVPDEQRLYRVALAAGSGAPALVLPSVPSEPADTGGSPVPLSLLVTVLVLFALAVLAAVWQWLRRRVPRTDATLREVPLGVSGLVKEYAGGLRAVDDASWRAEPGQVVGLLGPNGAGKTTTMRMLVGLICPDAGQVHVLGEEVRPGSSVLGRVGALIEGPGFLPHLTGRQNLATYWAATGRPSREADVEEVLAIADLGAAADRVVRSYSHGMRQRLGIAQAMLGLPEVLLLDEPTNGLDPPQIRAMRDVLARYAAGGRTVVVSSHLLGEVEQTCSHVVVMHQGRVVLTGAVHDLVEASGATLIDVDGTDGTNRSEAGRAAALLADVPGVSAADVTEEGVRVTGTASRPALVSTLVTAGVGVHAVDGRRHLEEVFMSLVGQGDPGSPSGPEEQR